MKQKSDDQIIGEIETHHANAFGLLKKSREMQKSASDPAEAENYEAAMKRAIEFQTLAAGEMQKAAHLQNILSRRHLSDFEDRKKKFGIL